MKKILLTGCAVGLLWGAQAVANEAALSGTLSKIANAKSITLGYRDASVPFSYVGDHSGKPMGYSVDLATKIVARSKVPVIPLALRGLWGHLLSHRNGHLFERAFKAGLRSRLSLAVGVPVAPEDATPELLQQKVQDLRGKWK